MGAVKGAEIKAEDSFFEACLKSQLRGSGMFVGMNFKREASPVRGGTNQIESTTYRSYGAFVCFFEWFYKHSAPPELESCNIVCTEDCFVKHYNTDTPIAPGSDATCLAPTRSDTAEFTLSELKKVYIWSRKMVI